MSKSAIDNVQELVVSLYIQFYFKFSIHEHFEKSSENPNKPLRSDVIETGMHTLATMNKYTKMRFSGHSHNNTDDPTTRRNSKNSGVVIEQLTLSLSSFSSSSC